MWFKLSLCYCLVLIALATAIPQEFASDQPAYDYYDDGPLEAQPNLQAQAPQIPQRNSPQIRAPQIRVPQISAPLPSRGAGVPGNPSLQCPERSGYFEDPVQCDKYYKCDNFVPVEKLCDDGLVYDTSKGSAAHADPCDSPYVVDCTERQLLQEATSVSVYCPRRHGLFADPDPTICNVYYTCIKGVHTVTSCASGLHFDENTGTCTWPNVAKREGCAPEKSAILADGFQCPTEEQINDQGVKIPHPTYPNLNDCAKFYVCLNGIKPQEASCSLGNVFNTLTMMCDIPEFVPECARYYENYDDETILDAGPGSAGR